MEFIKVGRFYINTDDIAFVDVTPTEVQVVFSRGASVRLNEAEGNALRSWLPDKVKEELQLAEEDEG